MNEPPGDTLFVDPLFDEAWAALGGGPHAPVTVQGSTGLAGPLAAEELALAAVAAQLLAAREWRGAGSIDDRAPVELDARHVGLAVRSERFVRRGDRPVGPGFAPMSRFWRTADGWVRLHANYPHHRAAVLSVLGEDDPDATAAALAAVELEEAVVAAGGAAAAVRTEAEWAGSPPGRAVAGLPLLGLDRIGEAPARDAARPRVLALTRVIAGPVAARTLAAHGADVLRLESPRLPEDPGTLADTGSGQRTAVLDLATHSGRATAEELLAAADVVLLGYRPGALEALGLDPAELAVRHPHLVVVRLSAWGTDGPWGRRRGFDSLVQAATGIATACGGPGAPGALPAQVLDHATGHLAAAAALRALARRRAEGGTWSAELALARTAARLLAAGRRPDRPGDEPDPAPYLVDLPADGGPLTVVGPPGCPPWTHAALPAEPAWLAGP
ncbi:CoA transferase [Trujillonella endophytica]|uniref:CoA-transferase family III n=1 Tax=Trujillonella endophytica TaxID=673521 RepID=A0A1H8PZM1_9ACTN|nr:CoA transferase [Trujillella endophytica]SEO47256.1 CoA-transferase family III [Trujillella endophytica]